ncbi:hypothetical protein D7Z26_14660 [Cohnella endophytica]|uniref:Uncharacterized protein n=1 Tax=Cohnella endophytica TaxID=2419778 RepID=A0A494XZL5_9BACL|nr:hypothetical protein D7Z26_14660 [Cohnella endophytica]
MCNIFYYSDTIPMIKSKAINTITLPPIEIPVIENPFFGLFRIETNPNINAKIEMRKLKSTTDPAAALVSPGKAETTKSKKKNAPPIIPNTNEAVANPVL